MDFVYIAGIVIAFIIATSLIYKLSGEDMGKIKSWSIKIHSLVTTLSFLIWFYESIMNGFVFFDKKFSTFIIFFDLFIFIILLGSWYLFLKTKSRKSNNITQKYGMTYYNKNDKINNDYVQRNIMTLFTIVITVVPILNIYGFVIFINENL